MYKESSSSQSSTPRNQNALDTTAQVHQPSKLPVALPLKKILAETHVVPVQELAITDGDKPHENVKKSKDQKNRTEKRRKSRHQSRENSIASTSTGDGHDRRSCVSSSNISRDNFFADSRNDTIVSNGTFDEESVASVRIVNEKKPRKKSRHNSQQSSEGDSLIERKKKSRRKSRGKQHQSTTDQTSEDSQDEDIVETDRDRRSRSRKSSRHRRRPKSDSSTKEYAYDKLIGVFLHTTSELKIHELLKAPRVRVSVCNLETKKYWTKSEIGRNIVADKEPDIIDYIQPVISRAGRFKNSR